MRASTFGEDAPTGSAAVISDVGRPCPAPVAFPFCTMIGRRGMPALRGESPGAVGDRGGPRKAGLRDRGARMGRDATFVGPFSRSERARSGFRACNRGVSSSALWFRRSGRGQGIRFGQRCAHSPLAKTRLRVVGKRIIFNVGRPFPAAVAFHPGSVLSRRGMPASRGGMPRPVSSPWSARGRPTWDGAHGLSRDGGSLPA
jgi:hypothetical protein